MRRVLLHRRAYLNNSLCEQNTVIEIGEGTALADYMTLLPDQKPGSPPEKTVMVHVHKATGEIDIDVAGVEMRVDHAALKVERD